jgi:toxin FitB
MFREWARLMAGKADRLLEDAMIAATAPVRGLVVVTRNVRDFEMFRVEVLNPFKGAQAGLPGRTKGGGRA